MYAPEITKFAIITMITKFTYYKNLNTETSKPAENWFCNVNPIAFKLGVTYNLTIVE